MRDQYGNCAGIDRPAEGADDILDCGLHRSPDAHLGDDDGSQDRPQAGQWKVQELRDRESKNGGNGHTQTEPQLRSVLADRHDQAGPNMCSAHSELPSWLECARSDEPERAFDVPYRTTEGTHTMDVGFVGLGRMGKGIAQSLIKAGHRVRVWNRSPGPAEELRKLGAE